MRKYQPSPLEEAVSILYQRMSIYRPEDIQEKYIAKYFRIYIYKKPVKTIAYENGRFQSITIDDRLPEEKQREHFFHELCHILRHYGWQYTLMPKAFKDLQEWDARRFTTYAAIPYHMLKHVDLDAPDAIEQMVNIFNVTPELCEERLEQIRRRLFSFSY